MLFFGPLSFFIVPVFNGTKAFGFFRKKDRAYFSLPVGKLFDILFVDVCYIGVTLVFGGAFPVIESRKDGRIFFPFCLLNLL